MSGVGTSDSPERPLALSVGCPSGVGPEIAVEAAARSSCPLVLVGDETQLREIALSAGLSLDGHSFLTPGEPLPASERVPGAPSPRGGAFQLACIDAALDLVTSGRASALVTGPVSKAVIAASGAPSAASFRGHTEHLQARLAAPEVVMAFHMEGLVTALVTTHLALRSVPDAIDPDGVARATFWLGWLLDRLGTPQPRVTVAALNPHAGENGLLGDEESTVIAPGLVRARERLVQASLGEVIVDGPMGAETAYRRMKDGGTDGVVAMYHDQATIPMKLLGFGEAVNVSLGLPIIRTSVDHGTGYDRAGQRTADPRGLAAAIDLARRLVRGRAG
jgi:4-hydroxythreonine-4-phosphate dehydrogenase